MEILFSVVFFTLLALASFWDLRTFRIPNWVTLPGYIVLAAMSFTGGGKEGFEFFLSSCHSFGFMVLLAWGLNGKMGMGDAKLSLSIGGVLGLYYWLFSLLLASMLGLLVALWLTRCGEDEAGDMPIPFAPFLSIGAVLAYWLKLRGYVLL